MDDPAYATWAPYNRAYLDNYRWQKDVWHIPEFFPLLTEQQEQIRQGDHRPGQRQAGAGHGRRVPGQAAARSRPHQVRRHHLRNGAARAWHGGGSSLPGRRERSCRAGARSPTLRFRHHDFSRKSGNVNERRSGPTAVSQRRGLSRLADEPRAARAAVDRAGAHHPLCRQYLSADVVVRPELLRNTRRIGSRRRSSRASTTTPTCSPTRTSGSGSSTPRPSSSAASRCSWSSAFCWRCCSRRNFRCAAIC